ncbi:MAG: PD40 domain-containing protein [Bacteroidia bacterium]|nr:PD40 domain-containing protein [Bacteroidia bacterium]
MNKLIFSVILILIALGTRVSAQSEARLLRFPTISATEIVFSYAGDLYTVPRQGGTARRLTTHDGYEVFPRFSPDGSQIAFTGQYDGNTEVFLIPAAGGEPKRLTWTATLDRDDISDRMGPNNLVMTWTPDGKEILFRSRKKSFNSFKGQLFKVTAAGGVCQELPFSVASWATYSSNGSELAMNQVFREFRTWKYYRGGMADDVWIYNFDSGKWQRLFQNEAQDIMPMWHGNKIYFISDRDRTMNLFSYDLQSNQTEKLTTFTEYDIKFPSLGPDAIVFENGGYLYTYDLNSGKTEKISIKIADDHNAGRNAQVDASKFIDSWEVSPGAERLTLGARGDIWTLPLKSGVTRNLTRTSGVHERNSVWSPDGKWLAWISDQNGEDEIYLQAADGSAPPRQLTKGADTYKYTLRWSPDSKTILFNDKMLRLSLVDVATGAITQVDKSVSWEITNFDWSPDSKWIAYVMPMPAAHSRLVLYEVAAKKSTVVTDGWYNVGNPSFSPDGKYLYFVSQRDFNPIYSNSEWNHAYVNMSNVYLLVLSKEEKSPLAKENDDVKPGEAKEENKEAKKDDKGKDEKDKAPAKEPVKVKVDLDGLGDRVVEISGKASNYFRVDATEKGVYYQRRSWEDKGTQLVYFDLKKKEETVIGEFDGYRLTADQKSMVIQNKGNYYKVDAPSGEVKLKDAADLSAMKVVINKREEWNAIYMECWRQMRDFFWDPKMHGVDWLAMRKKYEPLLPYVNHRNDLNYLIGELIGELNVGHAYINGGDRPQPERIKMGLLGAQLSKQGDAYRIDRILPGESWVEGMRSPLKEIGLKVAEGNYILAVNGVSVKDMPDIYQGLAGTAGKQVELTLNTSAKTEGSWKIMVEPIDDESDLYYFNWVRNNIRKVDEATNGQVGYIHVPDMGPHGLNEFVKYFYPQLNKKALIIDVRGNGGGNVSPMLIERLRRELDMVLITRNCAPSTSPAQMVLGPKVCLIDQYSASDGDLFPYRFRQNKLGKLVGQRSWGGVVGIRGSLPLIDGGDLRKPEFSRYDIDGKEWIIEGHGVDPDIEVIGDPHQDYLGNDLQLKAGIEEILKELKAHPQELAPVPNGPDKSK